jgi:hypothetical protein
MWTLCSFCDEIELRKSEDDLATRVTSQHMSLPYRFRWNKELKNIPARCHPTSPLNLAPKSQRSLSFERNIFRENFFFLKIIFCCTRRLALRKPCNLLMDRKSGVCVRPLPRGTKEEQSTLVIRHFNIYTSSIITIIVFNISATNTLHFAFCICI